MTTILPPRHSSPPKAGRCDVLLDLFCRFSKMYNAFHCSGDSLEHLFSIHFVAHESAPFFYLSGSAYARLADIRDIVRFGSKSVNLNDAGAAIFVEGRLR
jgi:hypothetical protein